MCSNCFEEGHFRNHTECKGAVDWDAYCTRFEKLWEEENKKAGSSIGRKSRTHELEEKIKMLEEANLKANEQSGEDNLVMFAMDKEAKEKAEDEKKKMAEEMSKLKEGHSKQLNDAEERVQRVTEELEKMKKACSELAASQQQTLSMWDKVKKTNEGLKKEKKDLKEGLKTVVQGNDQTTKRGLSSPDDVREPKKTKPKSEPIRV